ncbi:MAG: hypothetical protein A2Y65_00610 [Deltaproteobacteria bacterium RBG_13_52_11]|nr:MAG: hypothetical protein A2Y65_00610 [Deltaproteobacteria bacterium RBG_13_52_11]
MKRILLINTMIFLVLCFCGVVWGQKSFVVMGKSEQTEAVQNPTMEMAIKDGLTRAIEEVVGGMVAPQDMKKRQEILSQEFYQKADTFILSYTIVDKTPLPTGYQVSLEVVVDTKGIEGRLTALGLRENREEGPRLREVRVVVSGIKSYQTYLTVEQLLSGDAEVQAFSLSEIAPTLFTWKVMMKGETGRLANRLLSYDFGGLKAKVVVSDPEQLEVVLSR